VREIFALRFDVSVSPPLIARLRGTLIVACASEGHKTNDEVKCQMK
jgi:hypothetical protein